MKESIEPYFNIAKPDALPDASLESNQSVKEETLKEMTEFIKDRINLKFNNNNKLEVINEVKEKFGLSKVESSNLVVSIISDLRVDRAKELLNDSTREEAIEQLKKEWGNDGKVKREEAERIERILAKTISKASE
jgi:hypothetical protein